MLPVDLAIGSPHTLYFEETINDKDLRLSLDIIEEWREQSNIFQAAYKNVV